VDAGGNDSTIEQALPIADKVLISSKKGRAIQMHEGTIAAKGDILLFLHADTRLPDNWLKCLLNTWQNSQNKINATAFRLQFDEENWPYKLICLLAEKRYLLTNVPHGDQAIAISKETYFKYEGFPDIPIMEEYGLFKRLNGNGNVVLLSENVVTSARRYKKKGPLRTALRNSFLIFLYYLRVSPHHLAKYYK